jgi:ATPase subunit of ABC transporter with duplicated ATPase domains
MANDNVIIRFSDVSFGYQEHRPLLDEVSFSVREGNRIALMGQNGAGKSTIFKLITGEIQPTDGRVLMTSNGTSVALGRQVMPDEAKELTVREYFQTAFNEEKYDLDKHIKEVFEVVNLSQPLDKKVGKFSGGQQARLLLAHALIQKPDILLLDEPTNNLDQQGIDHLMTFLMLYEKTVIVISHDADFLNAFTDGVLYLDAFTKKIEQYTGNYSDVVEQIKVRIERENQLNARMLLQIKEKRAQSEVFAHKGGKMRGVAKRMREAASEAEENIVEVREEDRAIRPFKIPTQEFEITFKGAIIDFNSVVVVKNHEAVERDINIIVNRKTHVLVTGPNGIGKSTLLEKLSKGDSDSAEIHPDVRIGYYKQDFGNLNYEQVAYDALEEVMEDKDEHLLRSSAAGFLLDGKVLASKIRALSEGQKGLLSFCRLVLMRPGLLILDEPTNHINFRHLPIISEALHNYEGAMVLVSHIPSFVEQIRIDETIDLGRI